LPIGGSRLASAARSTFAIGRQTAAARATRTPGLEGAASLEGGDGDGHRGEPAAGQEPRAEVGDDAGQVARDAVLVKNSGPF